MAVKCLKGINKALEMCVKVERMRKEFTGSGAII